MKPPSLRSFNPRWQVAAPLVLFIGSALAACDDGSDPMGDADTSDASDATTPTASDGSATDATGAEASTTDSSDASETDTGESADSGTGPCEYPAGAVEPMALNEVLSPYSWATAIRADGLMTSLDLARANCDSDDVIDWSPHEVLVFISIPAW